MQGSCLCGAVEFRVEGIHPRHISATALFVVNKGGLAILVETPNFSWVTGREHISSYVRPTGFRSDFCARRGSPVPNPLRTTAYYWVPAGLLDDLETLESTPVHRVQGILGNDSIRCPAFRNGAEAVTIARTIEFTRAMKASLRFTFLPITNLGSLWRSRSEAASLRRSARHVSFGGASPTTRRSILPIRSERRTSAALMADSVCRNVLTFDPSDTIPPSTRAIDPSVAT